MPVKHAGAEYCLWIMVRSWLKLIETGTERTAIKVPGRKSVVMNANAFIAELSRLLVAAIFAVSLLSIWAI